MNIEPTEDQQIVDLSLNNTHFSKGGKDEKVDLRFGVRTRRASLSAGDLRCIFEAIQRFRSGTCERASASFDRELHQWFCTSGPGTARPFAHECWCGDIRPGLCGTEIPQTVLRHRKHVEKAWVRSQ